jgi:hypothetical protein
MHDESRFLQMSYQGTEVFLSLPLYLIVRSQGKMLRESTPPIDFLNCTSRHISHKQEYKFCSGKVSQNS